MVSFGFERVVRYRTKAWTLDVAINVLLLGVDGGGTNCRARLADCEGRTLGEGVAGPANIRFGVRESFAAVLRATDQCWEQAGPSYRNRDIVACLAMAGASEPLDATAAQSYPHPFLRMVLTSDARAACMGAHAGQDGGIIIAGTGTVGWATIAGREHRVGGWGFPVSDEGSGAWLGCEAVRRVLWAHDGLIDWSSFLRCVYQMFDSDPHAIVRWMSVARPRDFASLAPVVAEHAMQADPVAEELMHGGAACLDTMATRLMDLGVSRLSVVGGLAKEMAPLLSKRVQDVLVQPQGDALTGALRLAQSEAEHLELR